VPILQPLPAAANAAAERFCRMNKKIMKFMDLKYPNILKQRFPTFGTVITVTDNEQDDVEIDSD